MEYVRCRMHVRRVIGRLEPDPYTRISLGRGSTGSKSRFVFRTRSDTHGCVYRKGFIRTHSFRRSQCRRTKTYEKEKKHGSNQQEHDPYPPEGIRSPAHRQGCRSLRQTILEQNVEMLLANKIQPTALANGLVPVEISNSVKENSIIKRNLRRESTDD